MLRLLNMCNAWKPRLPLIHAHTQVEKQQLELDRLAATLKQVETYNENMKGEIAVTRRAAYAVEGAVTALEKEKLEQDFRVDTLQVCVSVCVVFRVLFSAA